LRRSRYGAATLATPLRVLLADDHEDILDLLRLAFRIYGPHEVIATVSDGRKAVDEAIRQQPDLVVLDLMMPVLSGFEAVALIRTGSPRDRIAILSALDDHDSRQRAMAAGADLFLVKGMVPREMVKVMTEAVLHTAAGAGA